MIPNKGLKFEIIPSTFEENLDPQDYKHAHDFVKDTAKGKALEVAQRLSAEGVKICLLTVSGVKNHLSWSPGQLQSQSGLHIFHPMSDRQVKIYSARLYNLECQLLFGNRASKNLGVLVHRTSDHF